VVVTVGVTAGVVSTVGVVATVGVVVTVGVVDVEDDDEELLDDVSAGVDELDAVVAGVVEVVAVLSPPYAKLGAASTTTLTARVKIRFMVSSPWTSCCLQRVHWHIRCNRPSVYLSQ
jgi:L-cystine uptake protein TcyP (sodium:dicarboxylate symporter family)